MEIIGTYIEYAPDTAMTRVCEYMKIGSWENVNLWKCEVRFRLVKLNSAW